MEVQTTGHNSLVLTSLDCEMMDQDTRQGLCSACRDEAVAAKVKSDLVRILHCSVGFKTVLFKSRRQLD